MLFTCDISLHLTRCDHGVHASKNCAGSGTAVASFPECFTGEEKNSHAPTFMHAWDIP